jgi:hypothetical protein
LEKKNKDFLTQTPGNPVNGPLYFDPIQNREIILLYGTPAGNTAGLTPRAAVLAAHADNRLWGAEANVSYQAGAIFCADRLDWLVGFRHLQFGEGLEFNGVSTPGVGAPPGTSVIRYNDTITALSQFYGPQIGLRSHHEICGIFTFDAIGKLAVGGVVETVNINGHTTFDTPGRPQRVFNSGILAEPTNSGRSQRGRICFVPELIFNAGVRLAPWARLSVAYDFLYVDQLIRAGDQINPVDDRQVRSSAGFDPNARVVDPRGTSFHDTRFWAQGINLSLEFTY